MSSTATAVTTATFEQEVLGAGVPVLVDFWAPWCGPCRRVGPEVEAVATQFADRARVVKIDIDEEPDLAARYGIQSIPALFIFKNGQVADTLLGAQPRQAIAARLEAAL